MKNRNDFWNDNFVNQQRRKTAEEVLDHPGRPLSRIQLSRFYSISLTWNCFRRISLWFSDAKFSLKNEDHLGFFRRRDPEAGRETRRNFPGCLATVAKRNPGAQKEQNEKTTEAWKSSFLSPTLYSNWDAKNCWWLENKSHEKKIVFVLCECAQVVKINYKLFTILRLKYCLKLFLKLNVFSQY